MRTTVVVKAVNVPVVSCHQGTSGPFLSNLEKKAVLRSETVKIGTTPWPDITPIPASFVALTIWALSVDVLLLPQKFILEEGDRRCSSISVNFLTS